MYRSLVLAIVACVTAVLVGPAAIGQVETTPIPLPPKPNFSSMQFLIGTWNCVESNTRRPHSYGSTVTNSMDSSGYWMNTRTLAHATSWARYPTVSMDKTTYDDANKRWVDVGTDDQGNYGLSISTGFNGNTIVWRPVSITSVSSGNVVSAGATTYTTVSNTKYTYTGSFKESGGRTVTLKGTCNKTSS